MKTVYFAHSTKLNAIKVGCTGQLQKRISDLQRKDSTIELVGIIQSSYAFALEVHIQGSLHHVRLEGAEKEWFLISRQTAAELILQYSSWRPPVKQRMRLSAAERDVFKRMGKRGGKSRAQKLTQEQRKTQASHAAKARWKDHVRSGAA